MVAMSGGMDSSVAAALLKRAGFYSEQSRRVDVIGVFMKFWAEGEKAENRCCSPESEERARKAARRLKIPFYVLNFKKEFKKKVVDYFLKEYQLGRTPNPCVVCNKEIKFGLLLEKALSLGADFVATGHYARVSSLRLFQARDKEKDQSYFLWQLNQKQLSRILFPVGGYTKTEVRKLAKKFGLPASGISESQEVCFIQKTVNEFLAKYIKKRKPGVIVDTAGKKVGRHQGLIFYTIGQRKGIGLPGGPFWVLRKDPKKNFLVVTKNEKDLYKKELIFEKENWIFPKQFPGNATGQADKIKAKIRYRSKLASGKLVQGNKFVFDRPQRAVTPGQSIVFYKGQELLGGGIIK
ncbi:MAG: tRNA 2-thiouridine(34) synthase MnmA [Candidatus Nealsonbacteria bacterium]|nr:MAG: tRNA 2-thiouridine(34) synthase MnmA [Candidatus Nealsonbacteria bacterium]